MLWGGLDLLEALVPPNNKGLHKNKGWYFDTLPLEDFEDGSWDSVIHRSRISKDVVSENLAERRPEWESLSPCEPLEPPEFG
jgi:hypothetical protein